MRENLRCELQNTSVTKSIFLQYKPLNYPTDLDVRKILEKLAEVKGLVKSNRVAINGLMENQNALEQFARVILFL